MLRSNYHGQQYLINTMASLKENTVPGVFYENQPGICHGVAMTGLVAFFSKDIQTFNQRIDYIYTMHQANINLKENIALLQQQLIKENRSELTFEENQLISAWAFFDAISLYQSPDMHKEIFGKVLAQSKSDEVAEFAASEAIQNQGGLKKIKSWEGYYASSDLQRYLRELTTTAKKCNLSIGLLLNTGPMSRTHPHAASLCWDNKKKKWLFINANRLPVREFAENELHLLSASIFSGFWDKNVTGFETILYTSGNKEKETYEFFNRLKNAVSFDAADPASAKKIAELKQWDLLNKACKAVSDNDVPLLQTIFKKTVDLDRRDLYYEKSPLQLAVELKHLDCLKILLPHVRINERIKNSQTALHIAVQTKNVEIIELLIESGADVNIADDDGLTPLELMSRCNDTEEIMTLFIKQCKNLARLIPMIDSVSHNAVMLDLLITKFKTAQKQYAKELKELERLAALHNSKHTLQTNHTTKEPTPSKKRVIEEPEPPIKKRIKLTVTYDQMTLFSRKRKGHETDETLHPKKMKYTLT